MTHRTVIAVAAAALLGLHTVHAVGVPVGSWYANGVATWILPVVFLGAGLTCLRRTLVSVTERRPWALIGAGLVLYACGSVVYNVELASTDDVRFPSYADALWLCLYPLSFAGMMALVRARRPHANASLWLDGLIGGSVVAAAAAAFLLAPVFERGEPRAGRLSRISPTRCSTCS